MFFHPKSQNSTLPPTDSLRHIPPALIHPSPDQPRRRFDPAALAELTASIRENGILQPLTLRQKDGAYYLVAGERRLRAAVAAGLETVPCLVIDAEDGQAALLSLLENLQRADLDFLDESLALQSLIVTYHLSQTDLAARLGKSQSSIANKLRLLRLPRPLLEQGRNAGLSERHMRALLALPDSYPAEKALCHIIKHQLTVARTDAYIQRLKPLRDKPLPSSKPLVLIRDVRLFLNAVNKNLRLMQDAGFPADCRRQETDSELFLTIRIEKPPLRP